jgi:hypothetical protein
MTAQFRENLILDGEEISMAFCPPLPPNHPRLVELTHEEIDALRKRDLEESMSAGEEVICSWIDVILGSTACCSARSQWSRSPVQWLWQSPDGVRLVQQQPDLKGRHIAHLTAPSFL